MMNTDHKNDIETIFILFLCVVLMRVLLLEVHEAACSEVMALLVDHDRG